MKRAEGSGAAAASAALAGYADFINAAAASQGAAWLAELREQGRAHFAQVGLPTKQHEAWRHTSLAPLLGRCLTPAVGVAQAGMRDSEMNGALGLFAPLADHEAARLVFVDGRYVPELSRGLAGASCGFFAGSLVDAARREPALLQAWLGQIAAGQMHPLVALNAAFLHDGPCLLVPDGGAVAGLVHVVHWSTAAPSGERALHPRALVIVGKASHLELVESYLGAAGADYTVNSVVEAVVAPQAQLEHYRFQYDSMTAFHLGHIAVRQEAGSTYRFHGMAAGARLMRQEVHVSLQGEGAACHSAGLFLGRGEQHTDTHVHIEHNSGHAVSSQLFKGIVDDQSRGVFAGSVYVAPQAQKSDARQLNKNLVLAPTAAVYMQPTLEIRADDVKCTHGATVGQLDAEALFYLRSRGMDAAAARELLILAFANDVLETIAPAVVRQVAREQLSTWLGGAPL